MVQYSDEILNKIFGPELSQLTFCGAKELPPLPNYLNDAAWLHMCGVRLRDPALFNLLLATVKNTNGAAAAYRSGRQYLLSFVAGLELRNHLPGEYIFAIQQFEHCIDRTWRALECFNKFEHKALAKPFTGLTLYNSDGVLKQLNLLNNFAKHFKADQAAKASAPVWLTNSGLKSTENEITFDELLEIIDDLVKINHDNFVTIPQDAQSSK